jgi:hypothetical protein
VVPVDLTRNLLFVHIPRTGGTSIERLLGLFNAENLWNIGPHSPFEATGKSPQHFTYRELEAILPQDVISRTYKFAFVRNPWDRFLSEFLWRRRMHALKWFSFSKSLYDHGYLRSFDEFAQILKVVQESRNDLLYGLDGHLDTQTSFVVDRSSNVALDFIGRFEQFERDVWNVLKAVGIPKLEIPHENTTNHLKYQLHYSSSGRGLVESFYAVDIQRFGYKF